jgi:hypothetical protein
VGADGDRWCAFVGRSAAGDDNLFVLNVSQVRAGAPVSCNAPDPNCLLLADSLGGRTADFHATFFAGDTLVYYDRALTAYAWRPGMAAGRLLVSPSDAHDVAFCTPSALGTAIACLVIPNEQPEEGIIVAELYAGDAHGESEPLLSPVDSVIVATRADTQTVHRFGFAPVVGGYVAWSSRETPEGPELLKLQRVGEPASQTTVAADVHEWTVSDDGSQWFWLSAANELGFGTLQTASFPGGADPQDLLHGVFAYDHNRAGSVVALTHLRDAFSIPSPTAASGEQILIDSEVARIVSVSDQGHVAYAKRVAAGGVFHDVTVSSLDGTRSCPLETTSGAAFSAVTFAPGAESLLWARSSSEGAEAYHSRLFDCSSVALSPEVAVLGWMGPGHAVFIDDFDPQTSSGSLRFRKVGKDGEVHPEPPTLIAERASTYATWGPGVLLYTIGAGSDDSGLYVRAFGQ